MNSSRYQCQEERNKHYIARLLYCIGTQLKIIFKKFVRVFNKNLIVLRFKRDIRNLI